MQLTPHARSPEALLATLRALEDALDASSAVVSVAGLAADLDLTVDRLGLGEPEAVLQLLASRMEEHGTLRAGLARNPWLAALASQSPRITVVGVRDEEAFVRAVPVARLPAAQRLQAAGLQTLGEVADHTPRQLQALVGRQARRLWKLAHGEAPARIRPDGRRVAVTGPPEALARQLATALESDDLCAGALQLSSLEAGHVTIVGGRALRPPAQSAAALARAIPRHSHPGSHWRLLALRCLPAAPVPPQLNLPL